MSEVTSIQYHRNLMVSTNDTTQIRVIARRLHWRQNNSPCIILLPRFIKSFPVYLSVSIIEIVIHNNNAHHQLQWLWKDLHLGGDKSCTPFCNLQIHTWIIYCRQHYPSSQLAQLFFFPTIHVHNSIIFSKISKLRKIDKLINLL